MALLKRLKEIQGLVARAVCPPVRGAGSGGHPRRRVPGPGRGCDDGEGTGPERVAVAPALQRGPAVAGVRLLQADGNRGAGHGRIVGAVPDPRRRPCAGRPRLFDGPGHPPRGRRGRAADCACQHGGRCRCARRPGGRSTCLRRWGRVTRPGAVRSWAITVAVPGDDGGPAGKIAGRVCVLRKSAEAIRLAHQKVRRDAARKGNQVQPATLRFAEYVIVFTTFPESRLQNSLGCGLNSRFPGEHSVVLDCRLRVLGREDSSGEPRSVERRPSTCLHRHRWMTGPGRAPALDRRLADDTLFVTSPGARAGRRSAPARRTCSGTSPSRRRGRGHGDRRTRP